MGTRGHTRRVREPDGSGHNRGRPGETKPQVIVRFIRVVPVTVGRPDVLRFVVPAAAANHAPGAAPDPPPA